MESSETSTPPARDSRLTSDQVRRATFPQVLRGYDREAVHDLLDRVADWMAGKSDSAAGATPAVRDEIAKVGERTAGILTAAEEAAANLRDEAKHYAVKIRADADEEVRKARLNASQHMDEMIAEAEAKAQGIIDDAVARRRELNQAISSLLERRDEIASEAARLADELMEAVDALRSPDTQDAPAAPEKVSAGPESEEHSVDEPDSEETALFDVEPETGDEEVIEDDSEETKIYEPDTADLPQGPSRLLVDPDREDDRPSGGSA